MTTIKNVGAPGSNCFEISVPVETIRRTDCGNGTVVVTVRHGRTYYTARAFVDETGGFYPQHWNERKSRESARLAHDDLVKCATTMQTA